MFKVGKMSGILFKSRENIEFALKFNICHNLEFCIFKIPYTQTFSRNVVLKHVRKSKRISQHNMSLFNLENYYFYFENT